MKNIQTSNYARNANNPNAIAISYSCPKWYTGKRTAELAPTWNLVQAYKDGVIKEEEYSSVYIQLLNQRHLTPSRVLDMIPDETILLCYESPGEFCHRRVLADWITHSTGVVIEEWKNKKELIQYEQVKLVDSLFGF